VVRERKDLSDDTKRKMLHDNVARFYKLSEAV
jgi:predicted TIM-barrel fold metal-dependent hydrolase